MAPIVRKAGVTKEKRGVRYEAKVDESIVHGVTVFYGK